MKARPCLTQTTWAGWDPAGLCSLGTLLCAGLSEQVLVWKQLAGLGEGIDPKIPKACICCHVNVSILKCPCHFISWVFQNRVGISRIFQRGWSELMVLYIPKVAVEF